MKQINIKAIAKTYWQYMKRYRFLFLLEVIIVTIASVINTISPLVYKRFFDILTDTNGLHGTELVKPLVGVIVLVLIVHIIGWISWRSVSFLDDWLHSKMVSILMQAAHDHIHRHSFGFFLNNMVGSLTRKSNLFVQAFEELTGQLEFALFPLLVILTGDLVVLYLRNKTLATILLIWTVLFLALNYIYSIWKLKYDAKRADIDSEASGVLSDSISNASVIKQFNGMKHERGLYGEVTERLRKIQLFTWNLNGVVEAIQTAMMIAIEFLMFRFAIDYYVQGLLTVGDFVLIQVYVIGICAKLWDFGRVIRRVYKSMADANEMIVIMDKPEDVKDIKNAQKLNPDNWQIEFRDVYFNYHKTHRVLNGLNIDIKPGEKIALVGPSGAGKSTIVKLLMRLYDVEQGRILVGGQNIARVTQDSLRVNIASVPQDPVLFHRTIMENIRYGRFDATDDEVMEAAKKAKCHDFITELQDGYKSLVGERGVKLSGGERQRIAIARAILKNAPILILDEATSSLDSESEALIQEALRELMKGKTTIVIAHRLSTIMKMDRIVVIDKGKVVDVGTHKELTQRENGIYKTLWEIQAGGFLP